MKKALKISGISLASILILLIILPFLFQGKLVEIAKKEANKMLNAKVDFNNLSLSFIRNFPNASITVDDFSIVGINEFKNDTLASFDRLKVIVNVTSLFGDQIEITKIRVSHPRVLAKVLPEGKVNWDIMKPTEEVEKEDTTATSFKLQLKKLTIEEGYIVYDDQEGNMKAIVDNLNFSLSGDMTQDETKLQTLTNVEKLTFIMDKVSYISEAKVEAKVDMDADLKNYKFTFSDNQFQLNEIKANFDGWIALLDNGYDMDIKLKTPDIEFKDLLSMIPAIYAKDFESIQTKGKISLDAFAKGLYTDSIMPAFDLKMKVSDGYFKYPALPKSVNNINIDAQVSSPGGDLDLTVVNISKFHFDIDKNPFDFYLKLANPISDPLFNAGAKGTLNLDIVKEVYPLDKGTDISGIITADMNFGGRLSYLEKEQYESFTADGSFGLNNFTFIMPDFKPVKISTAAMSFTPQYVNLSKFDMTYGNNDFQATGKLENFIAYALRNETIKGELNLTSSNLNINDFMTEDSTAVEDTTTEEPLSVIEVPKNINFTMNAALKKVTYDKIILENIEGIIKVADGKVSLENANMNAFGGTMGMTGYYSTQDLTNPEVDMILNIKEVLFTEVYKQADMVQQMAPIFDNMTGKFSTDFSFNSKLGQDMMPIYNSVVGKGTLISKDFSVSNVKALDALATALKNESLRTIKSNNLKINFKIENGKVTTEPFDVNMGTIKMNVSGSTGLDQTIDYVSKVELPQSIASTIPMKVDVKIGGTFTKPTIKLGASEMLGAAKEKVKATVNENLTKLVDEARKKKEALVSEAKKQADNIRAEAKKAGEKLVSEAKIQSEKLVKEAKNPLAKVAAQKSGDVLVKEAEKKATELNKKADTEANKLVYSAEQQGNKLIKEAEAKAKI